MRFKVNSVYGSPKSGYSLYQNYDISSEPDSVLHVHLCHIPLSCSYFDFMGSLIEDTVLVCFDGFTHNTALK